MAMVLPVRVSRPGNTFPRKFIRLALRQGPAAQAVPGSAALQLSSQNRTRLSTLPAGALKFRDEMFLARKADAEIGNERPGARNVERLRDRPWIEDRHPADANGMGARGEPECV